MATSPPYTQQYTSALSPPPQLLPQPPKRRQTDMPTSAPSTKRRKASMLSTTSASSHPLRQTSFPPETASSKLRYSRSPSVDENASVVSGVSKKRKRKSQGADKKGDREATAEEEDEGPDGDMNLQMMARTQEEKQKEEDQRIMLVNSLDPDQFARYEAWRSSKLADAVVRRIINQTLSQSAPASVILAVRTAAKIFAGEMVSGAVRVQKEWIEAGERQTLLPPEEHDRFANGEKEVRRGPLQPDHLREARRRYRAEMDGGLAGQLNLYQAQASSGVERFGAKFNGKRMLK